MQIPGFKGLDPVDVGKRTIKDYMEDDLTTYAGALTFRTLLAIFPFLIFTLTVLGALGMSNFFEWAVQQAQDAFPSDLSSRFEAIIEQVQGGASGGLLSFGLIGAIWAAAGGIRSAMKALNAAYDVDETRPFWKLYPMSILFTLGLAVILVAVSALMLFGPQGMEWLADQAGLGEVFVTVWTWLRIPTAIILMVVTVALVYFFFPNVDQPFKIVTPGSVIAVAAWLLATYGFSVYLSSFSNYNATYGSLGGVVVLLLYFFISAITLLVGAEVNAVIFKQTHDVEKINVEQRREAGK